MRFCDQSAEPSPADTCTPCSTPSQTQHNEQLRKSQTPQYYQQCCAWKTDKANVANFRRRMTSAQDFNFHVRFPPNMGFSAGMCMRPEPRPGRDPRLMSSRPRRSKFCPRWDREETFKIRDESRPKRDVAASETLADTLKLRRLSRVSGASTSRRDVFRGAWRNTLTMKKNYTD